MTRNENSNIKLNNHKTETNELIQLINQIIEHISKVNPRYSSINNVVITYRDKIFDIYSSLEKQSIDFWSNEFLLSDAILKHLEFKVYDNINLLLSLATDISKNRVLHKKVIEQKRIKEIESINAYIKNYDIKNNLYETLVEYYSDIVVNQLKPKDTIFSYIIIQSCLKDLKMDNILNKEQKRKIIQIIEQRELECIKYRKNFQQIELQEEKENPQPNKIQIKNKNKTSKKDI